MKDSAAPCFTCSQACTCTPHCSSACGLNSWLYSRHVASFKCLQSQLLAVPAGMQTGWCLTPALCVGWLTTPALCLRALTGRRSCGPSVGGGATIGESCTALLFDTLTCNLLYGCLQNFMPTLWLLAKLYAYFMAACKMHGLVRSRHKQHSSPDLEGVFLFFSLALISLVASS